MRTISSGERGRAVIREHGGLLYIGLPRNCSGGKQRAMGTGLKHTESGIKSAQIYLDRINSDLAANDFDLSLERYKPKHQRAEVREKYKKQPTVIIAQPQPPILHSLYTDYIEVKRINCSPSTYKSVYSINLARFADSPHPLITEAESIAKWLLEQFTPDSALRSLVQIGACWRWAQGVGRIDRGEHNPYPFLISSLKGSKKKQGVIEYYSLEQRDLIISKGYEFTTLKMSKGGFNSLYAPLLELLFLTGLRWSEATALECSDWNGEKLTISKALVEGEEGLVIKNGLKREEKRVIPVTPKAIQLLDQLTENGGEGLIFSGVRKEGFMIFRGFTSRFWYPLLKHINDPSLPVYSLYSARRTFISLALQNSYSVEDVAYLAGNSANVIYKHYAGVSKDLKMGDFV